LIDEFLELFAGDFIISARRRRPFICPPSACTGLSGTLDMRLKDTDWWIDLMKTVVGTIVGIILGLVLVMGGLETVIAVSDFIP
jgi:hypothetical protein